jgi:integrase
MRKVSLKTLAATLFGGSGTRFEIERAVRSEADATTRNTYVAIRRLAIETGSEDDVGKLYRDWKGVVAWVNGKDSPPSPASKLCYYSALSAAARLVPAVSASAASKKMFRAEAAALSKRIRDERAGSLLDEREKLAIMPWPNILAAYDKGRGKLSDTDGLVAALYLAGGDDPAGAPRRLDYNAVRVFIGKAPLPIPEGMNYVVVRSSTRVDLVLQEFKTSKHYGPYSVALPASVSRVIHRSVELRPRDWLVHDDAGRPLTASAFGRRVARVMKRLTGKPIGASNLRKSFVSWLFSRGDLSPERFAEYARAMNHSTSEQQAYCRRNIGPGKYIDCKL